MKLSELVAEERERRWFLVHEGVPYHHWRERGDEEPPPREYWCAVCVGYFGVPHHQLHDGGCRSLGRAYQGQRQCACIECVVVERAVRERAFGECHTASESG